MNQHDEMTQSGYDKLKAKAQDLEANLDKLRLYKGEQAIHSGDKWHDNPHLYQVEAQERALMRELAETRLRLSRARVIKPPDETDVVGTGLVVEIRFDDDTTERFQLVGAAEGSPATGTLSSLSPLGKAIIGAKVGDIREYEAGRSIQKVTIISISK